VESDDAHPALRERAQLAMDAWRILLQRIVDKGIMRGELHSTVDASCTILIATIEGSDAKQLYGDASHLERAFFKTYVQHQPAAPV